MGRLLVWLVLAGLQAAWAADYRLIQATSLFSFVAQANELATEGYRLTVWDSRVTYCGIFERLVEDDPARYEYAGVPTTQRFQKKIRESLNRLGSDGFRVIPQGFGLATAVLMERRTGETQHFDYEYGRAQMEDLWVGPFFGRKPAKFDGQGYGLVSLVRPPLTQNDDKNKLLTGWVWERSDETMPTGGLTLLTGEPMPPSTPKRLQRDIDKLAKKGYRFLAGGPADSPWQIQLWFQPIRTERPYQYKVFGLGDPKTLAETLRSAGAEGYRLVEGGATHSYGALMERAPGETHTFQYSVLSSLDLGDLISRINEAAATGGRPRILRLSNTTQTGQVVVLETVVEARP